MKRRFTEEQIIGILGEHAAGGTVTGDHPAHGVSEQSFYRWKAKHAGLEVSELRRPAAPSEGAGGGERQAGEASGGGAPGQFGLEGCRLAKVVRPAGKGKVVSHLVSAHGISERRACRLAELNLSTWQYRCRGADRPHKPPGLRARIGEPAYERRRFGYRRIHALPRREGWGADHKAVHRIYVEESLQVRKRKRKRISQGERPPWAVPQAPGERWSMDFQPRSLGRH